MSVHARIIDEVVIKPKLHARSHIARHERCLRKSFVEIIEDDLSQIAAQLVGRRFGRLL
jgi:hypothetical protein